MIHELIAWVGDWMRPEYCACGEKMIAGQCPLGIELDEECGEKAAREGA